LAAGGLLALSADFQLGEGIPKLAEELGEAHVIEGGKQLGSPFTLQKNAPEGYYGTYSRI
ncbi:MAG: hypothetical protein V1820_03700, partial [archaeon]